MTESGKLLASRLPPSASRSIGRGWSPLRPWFWCLAIFVGVLLWSPAVLTGCGRRTNPIPPELVVPEPIRKLSAGNVDEGIILSWERPKQRVGGTRLEDLGAFHVLRGEPEGSLAVVATLEVSDRDRFRQIQKFRYLDTSVTMGVAYRYVVRSVTLDDYVSPDSNIVEITRLPPTPSPRNVATPTVR